MVSVDFFIVSEIIVEVWVKLNKHHVLFDLLMGNIPYVVPRNDYKMFPHHTWYRHFHKTCHIRFTLRVYYLTYGPGDFHICMCENTWLFWEPSGCVWTNKPSVLSQNMMFFYQASFCLFICLFNLLFILKHSTNTKYNKTFKHWTGTENSLWVLTFLKNAWIQFYLSESNQLYL